MSKPAKMPPAKLNDALHYFSLGKLDEAEHHARLAAAQQASHPAPLLLLGRINQAKGNPQGAFAYFKHALSLQVSDAAYLGMAQAAYHAGNSALAEKCLQQLLQLNPQHGEGNFTLGNLLSKQKDRETLAKPYLQKSITLKHRLAESHLLLGNIYQYCDYDYEAAVNSYLAAHQAQPDYVAPLSYLGDLYTKLQRPEQAITVLQHALQLAPDMIVLYENLSVALLALGRHAECLDILRQGLARAPDNASLRSAWLCSLNYSELVGNAENFTEHKKFGELCADPLYPAELNFKQSADPNRKLRVAYVSGDFKKHPVVYFLEPILQHHDRRQIEIYSYYTGTKQDEKTVLIRSLSDHWREVYRMSDTELAEQIRADGIDIVMDLSGHTTDNRLLALARKPAPVQITWLGYSLTTGMKAMDYVLLDHYFYPGDSALAVYVEKPVYLPIYRVFRPATEMPVQALPALKNGYITFGSFNNFVKLPEPVLQLWAQLLQSLPDSRLLIIVNSKDLTDHLRSFFGARGINPDRLDIRPRMQLEEFLTMHHQVDIALDPFPFNGATTSFHGLWMGVPMISLEGDTIAGRSGVGLLGPLKMEQFLAHDQAHYLQIAQYWASHLDELADIRRNLRQRLQQSPLMDEAGYTLSVERAYRQCWQEWCNSQRHPAS